jgi:hypothetical protein
MSELLLAKNYSLADIILAWLIYQVLSDFWSRIKNNGRNK